MLLRFLLSYAHHLSNSMGIDHVVTLCGKYFSCLSFLDQLFHSKRVDRREHGKLCYFFLFLLVFFTVDCPIRTISSIQLSRTRFISSQLGQFYH